MKDFTQEDKNKVLQAVEKHMDRLMEAIDYVCPEGKESELRDFLYCCGESDVADRWQEYVEGF